MVGCPVRFHQKAHPNGVPSQRKKSTSGSSRVPTFHLGTRASNKSSSSRKWSAQRFLDESSCFFPSLFFYNAHERHIYIYIYILYIYIYIYVLSLYIWLFSFIQFSFVGGMVSLRGIFLRPAPPFSSIEVLAARLRENMFLLREPQQG